MMQAVVAVRMADRHVPLDTVLLDELNHRVGNVFQLATGALEIAARRTRGDPVEHTLRRAIVELHAHATVHRMLGQADQAEHLDIAVFLQKLCGAVEQALSPDLGVSIRLEACRVMMPAEAGRLLGILVHELVLNAAKHAFGPGGGNVVVRLEQPDDCICCSVIDDGLGLTTADPVRRGLGMTLVDRLAKHVGASCTWHIRKGGTKAMIVMNSGR